jgi:hypothetical protein
MTPEEAKRLRLQQEANSAAIARMQMQLQAQGATHRTQREDVEDEPQPQPNGNPQAGAGAPQYQQVDPNIAMLNAITNAAAQRATQQVQQNLNANDSVTQKVKTRMQRLVADYPALAQEDSDLVVRSRESYARIAHENPGLDEATRYELAVREAASLIGARPVNAPVEDFATGDFVMPAGRNPALPTRATKSRLTDKIIANARLMGINVDPQTKEGKQNLAELSEYSARFNADVDESQYRYR